MNINKVTFNCNQQLVPNNDLGAAAQLESSSTMICNYINIYLYTPRLDITDTLITTFSLFICLYIFYHNHTYWLCKSKQMHFRLEML